MVPLFELDGVSLRRSGHVVLDVVDLVVPDRGITVLTGASGSGKSTVLRLCNRLLVPDSGNVRFRGDDVSTINPCELRRRVGMVFQKPIPFAGTVADNLRVASNLDDRAAGRLLDRVALDSDFLGRDALKLSGGEQQRMCLARTMATGPEALLVDEGTSALDAEATSVLEELVAEEAERGVAVLWVTHDMVQADRIANHRLSLDAGPGGGADGADGADEGRDG